MDTHIYVHIWTYVFIRSRPIPGGRKEDETIERGDTMRNGAQVAGGFSVAFSSLASLHSTTGEHVDGRVDQIDR